MFSLCIAEEIERNAERILQGRLGKNCLKELSVLHAKEIMGKV